ncbi:MAG: hypothetical protein QGI78_01445 [Phycisphaerales bacterium]|jgi:putative colanic acid biosynthesis acetyltransferase WcaF|nr:hypothetical protein [Phycisphaerales bacterium]
MSKKTGQTTHSSGSRGAAQSKAMEAAPPTRRTVWSPLELLIRIVWSTLAHVVWVFVPPLRSTLLRLFGAKVGKKCSFARTVKIIIPWNLEIGDHCNFADEVILYSLGPIIIGDNVRIDTRAHLCAGTHDMKDTTFPLLRPPISIGNDTFIGIDAYIAPNVVVGNKCTIWPRTSVFKSCDNEAELSGNPARVVA